MFGNGASIISISGTVELSTRAIAAVGVVLMDSLVESRGVLKRSELELALIPPPSSQSAYAASASSAALATFNTAFTTTTTNTTLRVPAVAIVHITVISTHKLNLYCFVHRHLKFSRQQCSDGIL